MDKLKINARAIKNIFKGINARVGLKLIICYFIIDIGFQNKGVELMKKWRVG